MWSSNLTPPKRRRLPLPSSEGHRRFTPKKRGVLGRRRMPTGRRMSRHFEALERRELLAGDLLDDGLTPNEQLGLTRSALQLLGSVGDKLADGLSHLQAADDVMFSAERAIELLNLDGVPLVDESLGEVAQLSDRLRQVAARASATPQIEFAAIDGSFEELTEDQRLHLSTGNDLFIPFTIPAYDPGPGTTEQRAERWADRLNQAVVDDPAWTTGDVPRIEWSANGQSLTLAVTENPETNFPFFTELLVMNASIEIPDEGLNEFSQAEGDIQFDFSMTLSSLDGDTDTGESTLPLPDDGEYYDITIRRAVPVLVPTDEVGTRGGTDDNINVASLASDYAVDFGETPVEFPADAPGVFGRVDTTLDDGGGSDTARTLGTFFQQIFTTNDSDPSDVQLHLVPRTPQLQQFALANYRVVGSGASSPDQVIDVRTQPVATVLGIDARRSTAQVNADVLAAANASGQTADQQITAAIRLLMEDIGVDVDDPDEYSFDAATDLLQFTIIANADVAGAQETGLVDLDFNRSIDVGPWGDLELVAAANADLSGSVGMNLTFQIDLSDTAGIGEITGATLLSELDGGRGIEKSVGLVAANPPTSFSPDLADGSALPLLIGIDETLVSIVMPPASMTADNVTLGDLAEDLNTELAATTDWEDRLEFAAVDGAIRITALDRSIEKLALGELTPEVESVIGFRSNQKSSDVIVEDFGRVGFAELVVVRLDAAGELLQHFFIDLDDAFTIGDVLLEIRQQTGGFLEAFLVDDHIELVSDSDDFVIAISPSSPSSVALYSLGLSVGVTEAASLGGRILRGQSLDVVPTAQRFRLLPPSETQDSLDVSVTITANDLNVGGSLGFIGLELTQDPADPLEFTLAVPVDLQIPGGEDWITFSQLIEVPDEDVFAPVQSLTTDISGTLQLSGDILGLSGPLASLSVARAPGTATGLDFTLNDVTVGGLLDELSNFDVNDLLNVAKSLIESLSENVGDSALLNAEIPVVGASVNDIIQFADQLLVAIDEVTNRVDEDVVREKIDSIETALDNLDKPLEEKVDAKAAVQNTKRILNSPVEDSDEAIEKEKTRRRASRLIAAFGQLEKKIENLLEDASDASLASVPARTMDFDSMDVSGDGRTTARDALMIINHLARSADSGGTASSATDSSATDSRETDMPSSSSIAGLAAMDVNQSGGVTALDALIIINAISRRVFVARESNTAESESPPHGELDPLERQLVDSLKDAQSELPAINELSDRIATAIRNQLPETSGVTFGFDIIPDIDGDASPAQQVAIVAGLEANYDFGPFEFAPEIDLGSLGPLEVSFDAGAELEGTIGLAIGFGVRFDPVDPTDISGFLIADKGTLDNDNVIETAITIGVSATAEINGEVSFGGFDLVGAAGDISLSDGGDPSGLAVLRITPDPSSVTTLGPLGITTAIDPQVTASGSINGGVDLTFLGRTVEDAVALDIPLADIGSLSGDVFSVDTEAIRSLIGDLDFDLLTIIAGVNDFLEVLETQLRDNLSTLPLVGGGLDEVGEFIEDLRVKVTEPLEEQLRVFGDDFDAIAQTIDDRITETLDGFFAEGTDAVGVTLTRDSFEITLDIEKSVSLGSIDFDTNVPFLPISTAGGIAAEFTFSLDVGLGVSRDDGVYFIADDTIDKDEIRVGLSAVLDDDTRLELDLFLLSVEAIENPGGVNSGISGTAGLDLGEGRIPMEDLFDDVKFSADVRADLDLALTARTGFELAEVSTNLVAGWQFAFDTTGGTTISEPTLALNNIQLNLGEFLGKTIAPIIRRVEDIIGPVKDVVDLLTNPVPGVSDLSELAGAGEVTLLDLALSQMSADAAATARKFVSVIQQLGDVVEKIDDLIGPDNPESDDLVLDFGNFVVLSSELSGESSSGWFDKTPEDLAGDGTAISNPIERLSGLAGSVFSSISAEPTGGEEDDDGLGISFPIFDQPTNVIKLLLGQTVDLVVWDIPTLGLDFGWAQRFPIFPTPPISVEVALNAAFTIDLGVGLDTRGLQTGGLLDGFFLTDVEDEVDIDEFVFSLGVSLAALLDIGVASAGIEGEIRGELSANFRDPDENGKLYFDELTDIIRQDGIGCVFDLEARVRAILRVVFKVLFFEGSVDIIDVTILEANNEGLCPSYTPAHVSDGTLATDDRFTNVLPDHLASLVEGPFVLGQEVAPEGTLIIHAGSFADLRGGRSSDTTEAFTTTWLSPGVVRVEGMGLRRDYSGVTTILFDGGLGADRLSLRVTDEEDPATEGDFPYPVIAHGGKGDDILAGGLEADKLVGGQGNDLLTGNGANDSLMGGAGNDTISGGDGNDQIKGEAGRDTISGDDGDDTIQGGAARDEIDAGLGNDDVEGNSGNDIIFGGPGQDSIRGGIGHDFIDGGVGDDPLLSGDAGNDMIIGGEGADTLFGGWGNDAIIAHRVEIGGVGGNDMDYAEGGPDDDYICGSAGDNTIYGGTTDLGISMTGISFDTVVPLSGGGYTLTACQSDAAPEPLPDEDPITLSGSVFRDPNRSRTREADEPLMNGIVVRVVDGEGAIAAEVSTGPIDRDASGRINASRENGQWIVEGLDPGQYRIEVVLPTGLLQTTPFEGGSDFVVDTVAGEIVDELVFGVTNNAVIQGLKWLDLNGNGDLDQGEPLLNGVTIGADVEQRGRFVDDGFLPHDVTGPDLTDTDADETGRYAITLVETGTFTVTEQMDDLGVVIPAFDSFAIDSSIPVTTIQTFPRDIVVYQNDFETSSGDEWTFGDGNFVAPRSDSPGSDSPGSVPGTGEGLLGRFDNDLVTLSLDNLPPARAYLLEFDLHVIGSWDGYSGIGDSTPDERFMARIAGSSDFMNTSFRNVQDTPEFPGQQNYPDNIGGQRFPTRTGSDASVANTLGYVNGDGDSLSATYRNIAFTFVTDQSSVQIEFEAPDLFDPIPFLPRDETWALDNVRIVALDPAHVVTLEPEEIRDGVNFGDAPVSLLHVVTVNSPSLADFSVDAPESDVRVFEDEGYFVEIWVSGKNAGVGVTDVSTTIEYRGEITTADGTGVQYGAGFTPFSSPSVTDLPGQPGRVGGLSAVRDTPTLPTGYSLFARIPFNKTAADDFDGDDVEPLLDIEVDLDFTLVGVEVYAATTPYVFEPSLSRLVVNPLDLTDDDSVTAEDTVPIRDNIGRLLDDVGDDGPRLDIDDNGIIDLGDLSLVVGGLGASPAPAAASLSLSDGKLDGSLLDSPSFETSLQFLQVAAAAASPIVINGVHWNDRDQDGIRDFDEPPSVGITVYVDLNGNGQLDDSEPSDVTDLFGVYELTVEDSGTYTIRDLLPPLAVPTFPPPRPVSISFDGLLHDVDPITGISIHARQVTLFGEPIEGWIGIDYDHEGGRLIGIASAPASSGESINTRVLYGIDVDSGEAVRLDTLPSPIGSAAILEGDIAISPDGDDLFLMYGGGNADGFLRLYRYNFAAETLSNVGRLIDPSELTAVLSDPSAMTFDSSGNLLVLDAVERVLATVNPANGQFLSKRSLTGVPRVSEPNYSMRLLSDGNLLVVEGHAIAGEIPTPGRNYLLNPATGVFTDLADDLVNASGLALVPDIGHIVSLDETSSLPPLNFGAAQFTLIIDGADTIRGAGGDDQIFGDNGVTGEFIRSFGDDDTLLGGAGRDTIRGQEENDVLWGGSGLDSDALPDDASENDQLFGDEGDDEVRQFAEANQRIELAKLYGQGVDSFFDVETVSLFADDNGRILEVDGFLGDVTLVGGAGTDTLLGGPGEDVLEGRGNDDSLDGRGGDDTYRWISVGGELFGQDTVEESGSDENDLLDFSGVEISAATISLNSTTLFSSSLGDVTAIDPKQLEHVWGTTGDDLITGNDSPNQIDGGKGKDTIIGGGAADVINGGIDDDNLFTSDDFDTFVFQNSSSFESDSLTLDGNAFALDFSGLSGSQGLEVNLSSQVIAIHAGRQLLLTSSASASDLDGVEIIGSPGDDLFIDATREQTYRGGLGNDTYRFDGSSTHIDEIVELINEGVDTIDLSDFSTGRRVDLSDPASNVLVETLAGTARVRGGGSAYFEHIIGGSGDDELTGNAFANRIDGGSGDDVLTGLMGDDTYVFTSMSSQNDRVVEAVGGGVDTVDFSATTIGLFISLETDVALRFGYRVEIPGIENAIGTSAGDTLIGDAAANELIGGPGNDDLDGGVGNDLLDGGVGNDSYQFSPLLSIPTGPGTFVSVSESDRIVDSDGVDDIDLSGLSGQEAIGVVIDLSSPRLVFHRDQYFGVRQVFVGDGSTFIENAFASSGGATLVGNDLPNRLTGGDGNDTLFGRGGDDVLISGEGTNTLRGEGGSDILRASRGTNTLIGGPGDDIYSMRGLFVATNATNTLVEGVGTLSSGILRAGGNDTLVLPDYVDVFDLTSFTSTGTAQTYTSGSDQFTIDLQDASGVREGRYFENVLVENDAATLVGNDGDNFLYGGMSLSGGGGNDILVGVDQADALTGGSDDDILIDGDLDFFFTSFDVDRVGLIRPMLAISREWSRSIPVADRMATLTAGIGDPALRQRLVIGDTVELDSVDPDTLISGSGDNWVFSSSGSGLVSSAPPLESFASTVPSQRSDATFIALPAIDNAIDESPNTASILASSTQPPLAELNEPKLKVRVIAVAVPTPDTTLVPPDSLTSVNLNQSFFGEVWVRSTEAGAPGLTGLFVDLTFDPDVASVQGSTIEIASDFELLQDGTTGVVDGLVNDLGGATLETDRAVGGSWVRVGRVQLTGNSPGITNITPLPGKVRPAQVGLGNVDWDAVTMESANVEVVGIAEVVGRYIFYDGSFFDAGVDEAAIATDKSALLPGQAGAFANYTSYLSGINGIMIDVADASGEITLDDLLFRVGNDDEPTDWTDAPLPSGFEFLPGGGEDNSDRVVIRWADGVIVNTWLQVTMRSTPATGLASDEVHYWGNAIGETGDSTLNAVVNGTDREGARDNTRNIFDRAGIDDRFDFNRDSLVNGTDRVIARDNVTNIFNDLNLISVPDLPLGAATPKTLAATEAQAFDSVMNDDDDLLIRLETEWDPMDSASQLSFAKEVDAVFSKI